VLRFQSKYTVVSSEITSVRNTILNNGTPSIVAVDQTN